jgi:hypothetical protein
MPSEPYGSGAFSFSQRSDRVPVGIHHHLAAADMVRLPTLPSFSMRSISRAALL